MSNMKINKNALESIFLNKKFNNAIEFLNATCNLQEISLNEIIDKIEFIYFPNNTQKNIIGKLININNNKYDFTFILRDENNLNISKKFTIRFFDINNLINWVNIDLNQKSTIDLLNEKFRIITIIKNI